jgi:hypothetical protein
VWANLSFGLSHQGLGVDVHDAVISDIVESIRQMVEVPATGISRPIGFTADIEPKPG